MARCTCTYEETGGPESGPSVSVSPDEACPEHGRLSDPEGWAAADRLAALSPPMDEAEAAYYEALEAEMERLAAIPPVLGCPAVAEAAECDGCGRTETLYGRSAYTLGWAGHPGAEVTAFQVCASCLGKS